MNVILFGATGMVGQGVLRECLLDADVERVVSVVRSRTGQHDPKLEEVEQKDLFDLSRVEDRLTGLDTCFFTLGVSSSGMSEEKYRHVTYDLTISVARTLSRLNPAMTFIYVSGAGTDSTELGKRMWARVKGKTENDLRKLPFKAAYMFRPGVIEPMHGIVSKTRSYRIFYAVAGPILPLLRRLFPKYITTTEEVARAMIQVVRYGYSKPWIEAADITQIARAKS